MDVDKCFGTGATIEGNRLDEFQGIVVRSMYNSDIQTTKSRRHSRTEIEGLDLTRPGLLIASIDDELPETLLPAKVGHHIEIPESISHCYRTDPVK